jgi:hypothetical protein
MAFGLIVVACMVGGACNMEAPMMSGAGSPQEECGPARKTEILDGIREVLGGGMPALTRADHNAIIPIADALRARRVDRLILRCVEWTPTGGAPRRGRTVGEDAYSREQLDRLFSAPRPK